MRNFLKFSVFAICISSSAFLYAETLYYDNAVYVGEVVNGKPHGQGNIESTNGHKYEGEWFLGTKKGKGTATWADGQKYVGEWLNDKRHGQGTLTLPSGQKYVGEFKNGEYSGQGTFIWPSGQKYVGEWLNDKRHGQGTFTWPEGQKYVGEWLNGDQHGLGTLTFANGQTQIGQFESGEFVDNRSSSRNVNPPTGGEKNTNVSVATLDSATKSNVMWFALLAMIFAACLLVTYGSLGGRRELNLMAWSVIQVLAIVPPAALLGGLSFSASEGYPFDPMEVASGQFWLAFVLWPFAVGYLIWKRSFEKAAEE